ncbi:hypothetical protein BFAG_04556 [Bacteroides fragilis 3_1_12]|uniref:Uncharacterized protein n=1 Tax=Bacteroides fragilis 3_1_12 TaxID=457424 RepID=A0ABN0BSB7_BACFG|nr:hypothetical protein BFAG_04556 [Bacteroides fragilis 3_1_12]
MIPIGIFTRFSGKYLEYCGRILYFCTTFVNNRMQRNRMNILSQTEIRGNKCFEVLLYVHNWSIETPDNIVNTFQRTHILKRIQ